jgi:hypothetical protein
MAGDPSGPPAVKHLTVTFGTEKREFTFDATGRSVDDMGWQARFWNFSATEPQTTLTFMSPKAECSTPAVDGVRLTPIDIGVRSEPDRTQHAALD